MLKVTDLESWRGRVRVLRGISFSVARGEVVAVIGPNGAGKSSLLGTLAGLFTPRAGKIELGGADITGFPAERVVRSGLSLVPERRQIFHTMTVWENLVLGAYHWVRRIDKNLEQNIREIYQLFPKLQTMQHRVAGTLSGGEQQMLAVGRGLMSRPRLLMLDEPSLGLSPLMIKEIMRTLARLKQAGVTVIVVEQNAKAALQIADRGIVLDGGQVVLEGTAADLMKNPAVQSAYLGKGSHRETVMNS